MRFTTRTWQSQSTSVCLLRCSWNERPSMQSYRIGTRVCYDNNRNRVEFSTKSGLSSDTPLYVCLLFLCLNHFMFRVYEWKEFSSELFKPYIRKAMKLKIESSGWDNDVLCPDDPEEEMRRKQAFIDRNEQQYGIQLDIDAFIKNEGWRCISKLMANSFWGLRAFTSTVLCILIQEDGHCKITWRKIV